MSEKRGSSGDSLLRGKGLRAAREIKYVGVALTAFDTGFRDEWVRLVDGWYGGDGYFRCSCDGWDSWLVGDQGSWFGWDYG